MVWFIERLQKEDLRYVVGMVRTSILNISPRFYNQEQLTAWVEGVNNQPDFHQRFLNAYSLVAKDADHHIIGFASLVGDHIDFLYVAADRQREGVATQLLYLLEEQAKKDGVNVLTTEASAVARPFFQKRGYAIKKEQVKWIRGISIKNVQMFKKVHK
ncbi:GNAT family N-acetyltransferase [Halobacillus sp. Nhm2S1]|uniref:GNAT family N-acetyltransferase n=1 Tax=Halobacillus sp. Nhm2S1 TaxID=2866716 RepID=UPI001C739131|nr:GNAT family N-acetyltransferase [Halobacillus sp. Nhm2S1]MBX0359592.1 GNAT family N-acetyltransferase [Halobacillus sp. Nhm2S1]